MIDLGGFTRRGTEPTDMCGSHHDRMQSRAALARTCVVLFGHPTSITVT